MASDETAYEYARVPLTPGIAASAVLKLFSGKTIARNEIVTSVVRFHAQNGGLPGRGDPAGTIKKALGSLQADGRATNVTSGFWKIDGDVEGVALDENTATAPTPTHTLPEDAIELGEGAEAVYLYYLPAYEALAKSTGEIVWPCKIGRTAGDPLIRVLSQAATALPEKPKVAAVLWTPLSAHWEKAFHGVLSARGKRVERAVGTEWYVTSPSEFADIAYFIDPTLREVEDSE